MNSSRREGAASCQKREEGAAPFPLFSVVIPAHNRSHSIAPTLRSVQEQSFADFECIVVDDGSADSEELRAVVEGLDDLRFRYVWRENGGGGAARNTGIEESRGRYIAFLDSDDFFLPRKLEAFSERVTGNPSLAGYSYLLADRGVGRYWRRPDRPIRTGEDMGEYLFVQNQFIQTSTIVLHREAALKTMFDPSLRKGQDLDFCLRLHRDGIRFFMIEEPLVIWTDVTEVGRTSRVQGFEAPLAWLDRSRPLLTGKAYRGYRATVLLTIWQSTGRSLPRGICYSAGRWQAFRQRSRFVKWPAPFFRGLSTGSS